MKKGRVPELMILAIGLVAATILAAQAVTPSTSHLSSIGPAQASQPSGNLETSKAQFELAKEFDQRILNTVFVSLSAVFLLVVLVGGLNWFTNYRLYDRESAALRSEIRGAIQEETARAKQELETLRSEFRESLKIFDQHLGEAQAANERILAETSGRIREESKKALSAAVEEITRKFAMLAYSRTQFEAEYFEKTGERGAAFREWVKHAETLVDIEWIGDAHFSGRTLTAILRVLSTGSVVVSYDDREKLSRLMAKMPAVLSGEIERVRQLMQSARAL